jgi:prepilin-type N-terminal cleavage/methylation domain-containing protein
MAVDTMPGANRLIPDWRPLSEAGFSLPELLIAVTVFLIISSGVTAALLQLTNSQHTIYNRTQLHAGVRSATELLQQEVGQAGRVALPGPATLAAAVSAGTAAVGVTINGSGSVSGMFVNEQLTIGADATPCTATVPGSNQETVTVTAINTAANQITATFACDHVAGATVTALGAFASGIVPPSPAFTNGSTGTVLKLYGDINGDGNMVYIEYTCDTAGGNLYRNVMAYDAGAKAAPTSSAVLLNNLLPNPGGTACFTYMPNPLPVVGTDTYVLDVAITLTVQTQAQDPVTKQFQTETKALLNVSPRNVYDAWQLASLGTPYTSRIQPMPASVAGLLP